MHSWTHRILVGVTMTITVAIAGVVFGAPRMAIAAPEACAPNHDVDPLRLLRQASLDIRGTIPSYDEYEAVRDAGDPVAEADHQIDGMLVSDAWFANVREYHRDLMWASMAPAAVDRIIQPGRRMSTFVPTDGVDNGPIWRVTVAARWFRGATATRCLNELQTEFDSQGRPVAMDTFTDVTCNGPGANGTCQQEGYVLVEPYWAPGTQVKVCAFDAQAFEVGDEDEPCAVYHSNDRECGCGENLQLCVRTKDGLEADFREALAEEPLRIFENIVRADLPYHQAFTTDLTWMNGTLTHYYRHQSGVLHLNAIGTTFDPALGELPDLQYGQDDVWLPVQRESAHAGVLTTYGFLGRFASNRGRANRFHTAFYCDPFVPPEDGLPPQEPEPDPNLRKRNGCDGCHAELEPAAAHWGRWRTGGTYGLLRPEVVDMNAPTDDCQCGEGTDDLNCGSHCSTYYVTADNSHEDEYAMFGGLPLATLWLEEGELEFVEQGPSRLVDSPAQKRQVGQCMVRTMAAHLLGRELDEDDLAWVAKQTDALVDDNYRFSSMVSRMVADERYRVTR